MNIEVVLSRLKYRNTIEGEETEAIKEHYFGHHVLAKINGKPQTIEFSSEEIELEATEKDIIKLIENQLKEQEIKNEN